VLCWEPIMNKDKRLAILNILEDCYQDARIELHYNTPFQLLIAVLLSAQATDVGVNKATKKLYEVVKEPGDVLKMGKSQLIEYIKTIGLYNAKASHIMRLSQQLLDHYHGVVPKTRQKLMTLPGVGRKTANVVLNELYGKPVIAVDTHIFRVCNRTLLAKGATPLEVELRLMRYVPSRYKGNLHQWLIQLGRYTCRARSPLCAKCLIFEYCEYPGKISINNT